MKKIAILYLILLMFGSYACKTNCDCPQWYEGDKCKTETRGKFLGENNKPAQYEFVRMEDDCSLDSPIPSFTVSKASEENEDFSGDASKMQMDFRAVIKLEADGSTARSIYAYELPLSEQVFFQASGTQIKASYFTSDLKYDNTEEKASMRFCYGFPDSQNNFVSLCCAIYEKKTE